MKIGLSLPPLLINEVYKRCYILIEERKMRKDIFYFVVITFENYKKSLNQLYPQ